MHVCDFSQAMEKQLNGKSTIDDLKQYGDNRNASKNGRNQAIKTHSPRPQRKLYQRLLQIYSELDAFCKHHLLNLDELYKLYRRVLIKWVNVEKDGRMIEIKSLMMASETKAVGMEKAVVLLQTLADERWQAADNALPVPDLANSERLDEETALDMWRAFWWYRHYENKKRWFVQRKATMYDAYFKFAISEVEEMMVSEVADLPAGLVAAYNSARNHLRGLPGQTPVSEDYQAVYEDLSTFGDMMQREAAFATEILECPSSRSWLMLYFTSFNAVADLDTKLALLIMGAPGGGKSTLMKMLEAVLLEGRIQSQGETSDKANKNGNSETNCTIAYHDELPSWAKVSSEQLNDKKKEITDGKNVHSRTVEHTDSNGCKRFTKETIVTELQALITICANTGTCSAPVARNTCRRSLRRSSIASSSSFGAT